MVIQHNMASINANRQLEISTGNKKKQQRDCQADIVSIVRQMTQRD